MRAPASMTHSPAALPAAADVGASEGALPTIALSWIRTPSPMRAPSCTTTLAPNVTFSPIVAPGWITGSLMPGKLARADGCRECRHDALRRAPVAVELRPLRRRCPVERSERGIGIEIDEDVPAGIDGLHPFGRVAQGDARDAGEV